MEELTGANAATQILAIVGLVMVLANGITMTITNKNRSGIAGWIVSALNVLAGNIFRNENTPIR